MILLNGREVSVVPRRRPPEQRAAILPGGGKRNSVRRYAFDAQHKLLGLLGLSYVLCLFGLLAARCWA